MVSLGSMVASAAVAHRFDETRKIDVFEATELLVKHWGWMFPGDRLTEKADEKMMIELSGRRSRYFKKGWGRVNENDPPPAWPS